MLDASGEKAKVVVLGRPETGRLLPTTRRLPEAARIVPFPAVALVPSPRALAALVLLPGQAITATPTLLLIATEACKVPVAAFSD